MTRVLAAAVTAFLLCARPASAHPAPFSYLDIVFRGGSIEGTLVVHVIDIAHELGITPTDRLLDETLVARERQRIFDIVTPRLSLTSDRRLTPQWESVELLKDDLALRLTIPNPE